MTIFYERFTVYLVGDGNHKGRDFYRAFLGGRWKDGDLLGLGPSMEDAATDLLRKMARL